MTRPTVPGLSHDFSRLRQTMVDCQIRTFDVTDRAVIERFVEIPRENFVPAALRELAYSDLALPVRAAAPGREGRRLLSPMVLARLLQEANVNADDHVLDVASATGYSTAIIAGLAKDVVAIESDPDLQASITSNLATIGLRSIPIVLAPLAAGMPEKAPFDLILVNGAVEAQLDQLFAQVREGGRLITLMRPAGDIDRKVCRAMRFDKVSGQISSRVLFDAAAPSLEAFRHQAQFVF